MTSDNGCLRAKDMSLTPFLAVRVYHRNVSGSAQCVITNPDPKGTKRLAQIIKDGGLAHVV